jgi:hypothetical protein
VEVGGLESEGLESEVSPTDSSMGFGLYASMSVFYIHCAKERVYFLRHATK